MIFLVGVQKDQNLLGARRSRLEKLDPFSSDGHIVVGKAGNVSAGPRIVCYEPGADGIGDLSKNDWYRVGQSHHRREERRAVHHHNVNRLSYEFRGAFPHQMRLASRPANTDLQVPLIAPTL